MVGFEGRPAPSMLRLCESSQPEQRAAPPQSGLIAATRRCHVSLVILGYVACAAEVLGCPKSVPSRHIANEMPASLRAKATAAMRLPRRSAIRLAHARSASVSARPLRNNCHEASTRSARVRRLPVLVMWPRRCGCPLLSSRGTNPLQEAHQDHPVRTSVARFELEHRMIGAAAHHTHIADLEFTVLSQSG